MKKLRPPEPSCSGSWNEQIATLGRAKTRTAGIVSDCAGNAAEVGRSGVSGSCMCVQMVTRPGLVVCLSRL